jgi:putative protease
MVEIGISTLKIEGRYKDAEYVALTTAAYRQAVDDAWAGRPVEISPADELRLEQVYSRGLGPFFLTGTDHQAVVRGRAPRHRGVLMGRVVRVTERGVVIEASEAHKLSPLKPGDGVVFDAADWRSPEEPEEGGRIFEIEGGELRFGNGAIRAERIRPGDWVWRTHDPEVDRAARVYTEAISPVRKRAIGVRVWARQGERLRTEWSAGRVSVVVESAEPLGAARHRGVDDEYLRAQFGRLGNTAYELVDVELDVEGAPFAPSSMLNALRREAVGRLEEAEGRRPAVRLGEAPTRVSTRHTEASATGPAEVHLLVRTGEQLAAAIQLRPASITLDYLDLYGLRPSIEEVRRNGMTVRVAAPRVLKPGEDKIADFLLGCECPILVRSAGMLEALRQHSHSVLIGDFSLNAANTLTAEELLALGLVVLTPAHDLNGAQIADLAVQVGAERIEAVAYQHLPVFHTEHCVFARFLSNGRSYLDCGRPCEEHRVALRDASGRAHPVMADVGCRNTVFGAEAQEASPHLAAWRAAGISRFRLEFAHESPQQVVGITRAFEDALAGFLNGCELTERLRRLTPQGVTEGSLFVAPDYLTLPVLQ